MFKWLADFFTVDGRVAAANAKARRWHSRYLLVVMERDALLKVTERDRLRVEAEAKVHGMTIVESERRAAR